MNCIGFYSDFRKCYGFDQFSLCFSAPVMPALKLVQVLSGHRGRVWNVSWHPEGNILTSCGEDKVIRLWGTEGGPEGKWVVKTSLTEGHERTIREVSSIQI